MDIPPCDCKYRKDKATYAKGPNILGQIVECRGWDVTCEKCGAISWVYNNEDTNEKEQHE